MGWSQMRALAFCGIVSALAACSRPVPAKSADACTAAKEQAGTPGGGCGYFGQVAAVSTPKCNSFDCQYLQLTLAPCDSAQKPISIRLHGGYDNANGLTFTVGASAASKSLPAEATVGGESATAGTVSIENQDSYGTEGAFDFLVGGKTWSGRFQAADCANAAQICPRLARACALAASNACPPIAGGGQSDAGAGATTCTRLCPAGYTCDASGTCTGGDPAALDFDLQTVPFSGEVTVDCLNEVRVCTFSGQEAPFSPLFVESLRDGDDSLLEIGCDSQRWTVSAPVLAGSIPERIRVVDAHQVLWSASKTPIDAPVANGILDFRTQAPAITWRVSGEVTLDGATFPACSSADPGSISFDLDGLSVQRACDGKAGWTFSAAVAPGSYDVSVFPPAAMHGVSQVVRAGLVVDRDLPGVQLDLREYLVSGVVTVDGAPPSDCARFTVASNPQESNFLRPDWGPTDEGQTCGPGGLSFSVYRPAGRFWALLYVPSAQNAIPTQAFDVAGPMSVALDAKTTTLSATVTVDGAPLTGAECQGLTLLLDGTRSRISAPIASCDGSAPTFSLGLGLDTYAASVNGSGAAIPFAGPVLATVSTTAGPVKNLQLDLPLVPVSGTVTLNGQAIAHDCTNAALYLNVPPAHWSFFAPIDCTSGTWRFSARVYPGTYSAEISPGTLLPGAGNPGGGLQSETVATALDLHAPTAVLALDLKVVFFTATVTENGKPIPPPCSGTLTLGEVALQIPCGLDGLQFVGSAPPGRMPVSLRLYSRSRMSLQGQFLLSRSLEIR